MWKFQGSIKKEVEFPINQSSIIYVTVHKCVLKNLQNYLGNKVLFVQVQALANQLLSNVCLRTPILQYLFVNVLPYQNISTGW